MVDTVETFEHKGNQIEIRHDDDAESPRHWSNLGTMACFHKRYTLGDETAYESDDYDGWDAMEQAIRRKEDVAVILPLYLIDHSGISIRTTSFNDSWDSGQIGFTWVSKADVRAEYSCKRITKRKLLKVAGVLRAEVEVYDQYLRGDVYGYIITDADGEELDALWGCYGLEYTRATAKEAL